MQRNDTLRAIAMHARSSHVSALFVVGWMCAGLADDELDRLLVAIHQAEAELAPEGHLAAYAERWGRLPDRPTS